jgi:hypothetical protein
MDLVGGRLESTGTALHSVEAGGSVEGGIDSQPIPRIIIIGHKGLNGLVLVTICHRWNKRRLSGGPQVEKTSIESRRKREGSKDELYTFTCL